MTRHAFARRSAPVALAAAALAALAVLTPASAEDRCGGKRTDEAAAKAADVDLDILDQIKVLRALSNDDVCTMPKAKLDRSIYRFINPKPDTPGEWAKFRALEQTGDDGKIDPDGLILGLRERREMLESIAAGKTKHEAAGITSEVWESLGPGNIGGRVRSIVVHPTEPDKIWLGSISGGIWHSADGGKSWKPVDDFMASVAVSTMAIDPLNPQVMYAGTGEGFFNADAIRGAGMFKSTDGGVTWNSLAETSPQKDAAWFYINRIGIDPKNSNRLLAATQAGIFRSTDAGKTWNKVTKIRAYDIDYSPGNPDIVIAAAYWGHVLRSTNGGLTWKSVEVMKTSHKGIAGRVEAVFARSKPGVVYAAVDHNYGTMARSEDSGRTWTPISVPKHLSGQGWYANALWVDPTDANHVIVGGLDIYRSTDGAKSFTKISQWYSAPKSAHADHHVIVEASNYKKGSNPIVYFGNDGGLYKANVETVKLTEGWESLNNGLDITQFYSVAASADGSVVIGGTQDNGSLVRVGNSKSWAQFRGGDGGMSAFDPTDPKVFYGEYVYLSIHRRMGDQLRSEFICQGIKEGEARRCGGTGKANFIAPFMLDPNNPNRMLAGAASLWISDNIKAAKPDWRAIKPPIEGSYNYIKSIAVAKGDSNVIWLGYNKGAVHATFDGGKTWKEMPIQAKRAVNTIMIDTEDKRKVYVAFGGYEKDNLYQTTDGGQTWKDISGALPDVPIRGFTRNPLKADWLYAGTEVGLYTSEDGGKTWSTKNDGPGTVSVDQLVWVGETTLLAATHGRGIFRARVRPPLFKPDDGDKGGDGGGDTAGSGGDSSGGSDTASGGSSGDSGAGSSDGSDSGSDSGFGSGSGDGSDSGGACAVNDLLTGKCK